MLGRLVSLLPLCLLALRFPLSKTLLVPLLLPVPARLLAGRNGLMVLLTLPLLLQLLVTIHLVTQRWVSSSECACACEKHMRACMCVPVLTHRSSSIVCLSVVVVVVAVVGVVAVVVAAVVVIIMVGMFN